MANYGDLITKAINLIDREDLAPEAPDMIEEVEAELAMDLRDYAGNGYESQPIPMVADQDYIELQGSSPLIAPYNYVRPKSIRINTNPERPLRIVSLREIEELRVFGRGNTYPQAAAHVTNTRLTLAPIPTTTDTITVLYDAPFEAFDLDKVTSQLLREAPGLLRYGLAKHLALFAGDYDMQGKCQEQVNGLTKKYQQFLTRKKYSGGTLRIKANQPYDDRHFRPWGRGA